MTVPLLIGFSTLLLIFLLVILLGMQIQISALTRRLDDFMASAKKSA